MLDSAFLAPYEEQPSGACKKRRRGCLLHRQCRQLQGQQKQPCGGNIQLTQGKVIDGSGKAAQRMGPSTEQRCACSPGCQRHQRGAACLLGLVMAWAAPNTPRSPNRMMNVPATRPPRMKAPSIVFGSARNARSVSTLRAAISFGSGLAGAQGTVARNRSAQAAQRAACGAPACPSGLPAREASSRTQQARNISRGPSLQL